MSYTFRGEIHFLPVPLPDRDEIGSADSEEEHFAIVLREAEDEHNVPFVIANTNKRKVDFRNGYEVHFDGDERPFHHPTIVDGRWVMTLPSWRFTEGTYVDQFGPDVMALIDVALLRGLQIGV